MKQEKMAEKKDYLLNGNPIDGFSLIQMALKLDQDFGKDGLCLLSEATNILRSFGHKIEKNNEM